MAGFGGMGEFGGLFEAAFVLQGYVGGGVFDLGDLLMHLSTPIRFFINHSNQRFTNFIRLEDLNKIHQTYS